MMNREELELKTKSLAQDLSNKIQSSPLGAALIFIGLGFAVGVFRGITIPLLVLAALAYGVFWLLDGGFKRSEQSAEAKKAPKEQDEGESLH